MAMLCMLCFPNISGCVFHYSAHLLFYVSHTQLCSILIFTISFFAVAFCYLLLQCGIFPQPRSWKIDPITERQRAGKKNRERELDSREYTGHWAAVSLTLCYSAVKCCCFNWSQTQLNTAVRSSQPDPKTTDTHPPTHTHTHTHTHTGRQTEAHSDRYGQDGREVEKRERD